MLMVRLYSVMGLINKNGMFLYPVEQSFRSYLRHLSTSSYVAWKLLELFATESLWNSMTLSFIAFSQITLSAVLLKNLFNEDGSAWSLFMFGIRIRCMTFQISLLFFEDKIFLKTEFSFLWLLFDFASFIFVGFPVFTCLDFLRLPPYVASNLFCVTNCWFWYLASRELVVLWILFQQGERVCQVDLQFHQMNIQL